MTPASGTTDSEDTDRLTDTLLNVELTEEGKKPQRELVFVTDEETAHVIDDPVRLTIIKVLREGIPDTITTRTRDEKTGELIIRQREVRRHALSVMEIVKLSAEDREFEPVTKNQVYHHLPRLIETGFVIKYGTVRTGKRSTDYYRRTARGFVIVPHPYRRNSTVLKREIRRTLDRLGRVFGITVSAEQEREFIETMIRLSRIEAQAGREVAKRIRGDVIDSEVLDLYNFLRRIQACGHPEWVGLHSKLREILFPQ